MKAVVYDGLDRMVKVAEIPDPEPGEGEVVIRVERCGICGTDVHATNGHGKIMQMGQQFGHEYAGEIVAVGKGLERLKLGDRIAALPSVGCNNCEYCASGVTFLCRQRQSLGQGLAEYCRVSEGSAVLLPSTVSVKDGALIEPLAVARRGVRLLNPGPDTRALVIGPGPIGLGVIFWLQQSGVKKIVALASTSRRRHLVEALGCENFVLEGESAKQEIEAILGGAPNIVIEAAGVPGVVARAIELVAPAGQIMALGFCDVPESFTPAHAVAKDILLRFSITYTMDDYQACADALDRSASGLRQMVTEVVSLEDFPAAFEPLRRGATITGKLACDPWS